MQLAGKHICIVRSSEFASDARSERLADFLCRERSSVLLLGLDRFGTQLRRQSMNQIDIRRLTFPRPFRLPVGTLVFVPFLLIWMQWILLRLLRHRPDVVIASDLDSMIPCSIFCQICRVPLIYDPHDFYADNFQRPIPGFLSSIVRRIEQRIVSLSIGMIIPDLARLRQYDPRYLPGKVVEIVNAPAETVVSRSPSHPTRLEALLRRGELNVLYAGLLHRSRGTIQLAEAVDEGDCVHLLFAGYGPCEKELLEILSKRRIGHFFGRVEHHEIMEFTTSCDVVFAMYDPSIRNNIYASPNKLFEAMACAKPVLVNDGTRLAELVRNHNCGLVVRFGDIEGIRRVLARLRDDAELRTRLGENGRRVFEATYDWSLMEGRLRAFFEAIDEPLA